MKKKIDIFLTIAFFIIVSILALLPLAEMKFGCEIDPEDCYKAVVGKFGVVVEQCRCKY